MNFDSFSEWSDDEMMEEMHEQEEEDENLIMFMLLGLHAYKAARERHQLTAEAYLKPPSTSWRYLFLNACDRSFLHVTGMSREAFMMLYTRLFVGRVENRRTGAGRKPRIWEVDKLGMLLMFLGSKMSMKFLPLIFGCSERYCSSIIGQLLERVVRVLSVDDLSCLRFPPQETLQHLAALVENREPGVRDVIGFIDGVLVPVQSTSETLEQSAYYTPRACDTCVNNVLAFTSEGKIILAAALDSITPMPFSIV
jgi:hypothetical protein